MFSDRDIEQVNFVFCCRDNFLSSKKFLHQQKRHCDDLIYQKEKKGIKTRSL